MAKAQRIKVDISGWTRFESFNFSIAPSLAGAEHKFLWRDQTARITCSGWRERNGRKVPLYFQIHQIDVIVETKRTAQISTTALERVDASMFNKRDSERLDRLAAEAVVILETGFDYWISILRWKAGLPTICQFTNARQRRKWGIYLMDTKSEARFYSSVHIFDMGGVKAVDARLWRAVARAIGAGQSVPVWRQHYDEAYQKLGIGDVRGFVLDLAIAIETITRRLMSQVLKDGATPGLKRLLGSIALGRIIEDWTKIGFDSKDWNNSKQSRDEVKKVIELRNTIMHRGEVPKLDKGEARAFGSGVLEFLVLGERELVRKRC